MTSLSSCCRSRILGTNECALAILTWLRQLAYSTHARRILQEHDNTVRTQVSNGAAQAIGPYRSGPLLFPEYGLWPERQFNPMWGISCLEDSVDDMYGESDDEDRCSPKVSKMALQCEACGPDLELYQRHR